MWRLNMVALLLIVEWILDRKIYGDMMDSHVNAPMFLLQPHSNKGRRPLVAGINIKSSWSPLHAKVPPNDETGTLHTYTLRVRV